jgi:hypothetical protein
MKKHVEKRNSEWEKRAKEREREKTMPLPD